MITEKNPFEIIGVDATASAREIEREGQRLLAMIGAGVADDCSEAREFEIRRALDELRDPRRRLVHEVLARALTAKTVLPSDIERLLDEIEQALPAAEPTPLAEAEEILWGAIEPPRPFVLPADHESERKVAFAPLATAPEPLLSIDEVDWADIARFRAPTKPSRNAKEKVKAEKGSGE